MPNFDERKRWISFALERWYGSGGGDQEGLTGQQVRLVYALNWVSPIAHSYNESFLAIRTQFRNPVTFFHNLHVPRPTDEFLAWQMDNLV